MNITIANVTLTVTHIKECKEIQFNVCVTDKETNEVTVHPYRLNYDDLAHDMMDMCKWMYNTTITIVGSAWDAIKEFFERVKKYVVRSSEEKVASAKSHLSVVA